MSMLDDLLAFGGIGADPVLPRELAARRPLLERRREILAAHLAHVEATAPQDAAPHREALARANGALAWLEAREAEEARYTERNRREPPSGLRDIKDTIATFLGR